MKKFFFYCFLTVVIHYSFSQKDCFDSIKGIIKDEATGKVLSYATIKVQGTNKGVIANEFGEFELQNICDKEVDLEIRYLGYKTLIHHHDAYQANPLIYLAPEHTMLESIVIENYRSEELKSLSVQKKIINKLSLVSSSIGDLTDQLTGVSLLKTGSNISKPMIHGLHSNRVLVINDGIRHAYQSWGQEHAPEIDPSHIDQIEIIKGAATVKYGPEALGGVILYNSKKPTLNQKIGGSLGNAYQTNGKAFSSQLSLNQGSSRFAWKVGAFGVYQGDLRTPDYNLSNTGKREYGASFSTFLHQPKFDLQISGSYFEQELGILRGSLVGNLVDMQNAIDRSVPNPTFSRTYKIKNPRQETEHGLLKSDLSLFINEHILNFQYAIQRNIRREYDIRRGENNERPIIDLSLVSHNIEIEWIQPSKSQWNGSTGIQLYTKNNDNEPGTNTVNFIPYYDIFNIGAFTVQSFSKEKTTYELGLRFDFQSLSATDTIREVEVYSSKTNFSNFTFTLGVRKQINESLSFFSNLGSAWRPPNVAELYAFGYHHSIVQFGLWRYEVFPESDSISTSRVLDQSDKSVASEKSIKWVSGIEVKKAKTKAEFIFYANHINDYLFMRPYGVTINIAGTFPYFIYDQIDAFFLGSDWDIQFNHTKLLSSEIKMSYVYAIERENQQALLEIPPLNINYAVDLKKGNWGYGLNLNYTARQWHAPSVINPINFQEGNVEINRDEIFDFMSPPNNYFLIGGKIMYKKNHWNVELSADNLLNSSYRVYTDRLRYYADAPGRNFSFAFEYKF
ncbi:MAG: TonB-dependent receptor [Bacteroidota bacterium]